MSRENRVTRTFTVTRIEHSIPVCQVREGVELPIPDTALVTRSTSGEKEDAS